MGNTSLITSGLKISEDHPHIHGEHILLMSCEQQNLGSPPHTWGTQFLLPQFDLEARITPTYMGNTALLKPQQIFFVDHPHIHGEHFFLTSSLLLFIGSPPHTWGTPTRSLGTLDRSRITPTYMGNTDEELLDKVRI